MSKETVEDFIASARVYSDSYTEETSLRSIANSLIAIAMILKSSEVNN